MGNFAFRVDFNFSEHRRIPGEVDERTFRDHQESYLFEYLAPRRWHKSILGRAGRVYASCLYPASN